MNGRTLEDYFPNKLHQQLIDDPFTVLDLAGGYDVIARISGGGPSGQAGALRLGIARALNEIDAENNRPTLKKPASSRATPASRSARRPVSRRPARLRSTRSAKASWRCSGRTVCGAWPMAPSPPTSRSPWPRRLPSSWPGPYRRGAQGRGQAAHRRHRARPSRVGALPFGCGRSGSGVLRRRRTRRGHAADARGGLPHR